MRQFWVSGIRTYVKSRVFRIKAKVGLEKKPYEKFQFSTNAYSVYGDKLKMIAELVAKRTYDKSPQSKLEEILKQSGDKPIIQADQAIQWCFIAGSSASEKSREGLRAKLKQL